LQIRPYRAEDEAAVIALWRECGLTRPWNNPHLDIARKLTVQPEWFLVGVLNESVIATAMAGYDGHRGWIYYLAVAPAQQRQGYGQKLVSAAENCLLASGCPKVNLMVRATNAAVVAFYQKLGYNVEEIVSLGKRLLHDETAP
jgi:ribosomal protein S18 acetylase RimI-like enzyme